MNVASLVMDKGSVPGTLRVAQLLDQVDALGSQLCSDVCMSVMEDHSACGTTAPEWVRQVRSGCPVRIALVLPVDESIPSVVLGVGAAPDLFRSFAQLDVELLPEASALRTAVVDYLEVAAVVASAGLAMLSSEARGNLLAVLTSGMARLVYRHEMGPTPRVEIDLLGPDRGQNGKLQFTRLVELVEELPSSAVH